MISTKTLGVTAYFSRPKPKALLLAGTALLVLLLTRFLFLSNRPIHFDESINGWFVLQMRQIGFYKYDPSNFHGPLYFYLLEIMTRFFGHSLTVLRILPALFSLAAVLFFWRLSPWTAILLALSPSTVFYGRYGIHESAFVLFQIYFFVGLYNYQRKQRRISLYLALLGLAGMMCLKETFLLTGFAAVVALAFYMPWKKFFYDLFFHLKLPTLFFLVAVILLFTGGLQSLRGVGDFFRAFSLWFDTGLQDGGHHKEFTYWLKLAAQTEPMILVGLATAVWGLTQKNLRVLSLYALSLWLIYSWTPYKTPWCMISWTWPLFFVLGEKLGKIFPLSGGLASAYSRSTKRIILGVGAGVLLLGWVQSARAIFPAEIDLEHPFVYVNSTYEFKKMDDAIQKVLKNKPELRQAVMQISLEESWPLPWTLQDSQGLRYDRVENKIYPYALAYFCELDEAPLLDNELTQGYVSRIMSFRQFGRAVKVYLRTDAFPEFPE